MSLLLIAALAAAAPVGPTSGDLCDQLRAFHTAAFDDSVEPHGRRWIELHWVGRWMDFDRGWGFKCQHSPDQASSSLCAWIIGHVSYEFPATAPKRILTCYGYQFPRHDKWAGWKSDISLLDRNRWLKLEIDFATLAGDERAIRLSSFAKDQDDALVELPPISPVSLK
jgi:hypothetical protein